MRVSIREQLGCLIFLSTLISLAILSGLVWSVNHGFILSVAATRLYTSASLKAAQIAADLRLMTILVNTITTRTVIRTALINYNAGINTTADNFAAAQRDIVSALGQSTSGMVPLALQAQVFAADGSIVLSATGASLDIDLPGVDSQGNPVQLGDMGAGYPPALYPNVTSSIVNGSDTLTYDGFIFHSDTTLVLGPMPVNETLTLISISVPLLNGNSTEMLGILTAVLDTTLLKAVLQEPEGLGSTGQTLLFGPVNSTNLFRSGIVYDSRNSTSAQDFNIRFVFPLNDNESTRHPLHVYGTPNPPFLASQYPAVLDAFASNNRDIDNADTNLATTNEAGESVSVGYALVPTGLVDWVVLVEQAHSEVWEPIQYLRALILGCLFGVSGVIALVSIPLAHFAVLPIRRLRKASEHTISSEDSDSGDSFQSSSFEMSQVGQRVSGVGSPTNTKRNTSPSSFLSWRAWKKPDVKVTCRSRQGNSFRIPSKVAQKRHCFSDEMSDLVLVFNDMVDELTAQYFNLEEKIRQRTAELTASKKAAEAANESKTLFIANLSHELKTPLNGILGMCSICLQENDFTKTKESLQIIYKSGDLLLKLLTDLLLFSENQIGRKVVSIEEKEFTLRDIEEQVHAVFRKQASEGGVDLCVVFEGHPLVPEAGADMRDMVVWGDIHRILQICMNLLSNAIKFSPRGESVTLFIRCSPNKPQRTSTTKTRSPNRISKAEDTISAGTANFINPRERRRGDGTGEFSSAQVPAGQDLFFEFEVRDNGPGIPEEQQQSIFEPFVQGDVGLDRKFGGTGLGLSICTQLAGLMKGTISVKSKPMEGSEFCLKLPLRHISSPRRLSRSSREITSTGPGLAGMNQPLIQPSQQTISHETPQEPEPAAKSTPSTKQIPSLPFSESTRSADADSKLSTPDEGTSINADTAQSMRVLVAEDNKVNQEIIRRMLKLEKIVDVTIADNGQEALDLVKSSTSSPREDDDQSNEPNAPRQFDIIFMDIQMPVMGGLESSKLIREAGCEIPIIALTAFSAESNVQACYANGLNFFMAKPIRRNNLRKVLTDFGPKPNPPGGTHAELMSEPVTL